MKRLRRAGRESRGRAGAWRARRYGDAGRQRAVRRRCRGQARLLQAWAGALPGDRRDPRSA